jgi:hypothetical protein
MALMGELSIYLFVAGAVVSAVGWALFFRMAVELNRVLPADKRIPLIGLRNDVHRVRRLYEDRFPEGRLSMAWLVFMVFATLLLASGIVAELVRTSK